MEKRRQIRSRRKPKVSTEDIVGQKLRAERIPTRWRQHFQRLNHLRDEMLRRQSRLQTDALEAQPSFSTHMADAGTDNYDRDFALGMLSSEQDAVYQIDQALDRIRNRTYGVCELTGKRIERSRLDAIPWTRFSAAAERQLEREGAVKRTRLGPREAVVRSSEPTPHEEPA
jgi:RNA polymerase-binding transcription factor DksA